MAEYPWMNCKKHGANVRCYVMCSHIASSEAIVFHVEHPDEHPGLIVCKACDQIERPLKNIADFAAVCAVCAADQGWITATIQ